MIRAASTYVFVKQRLHPGLLDQLARGGAEAVEIFGARGHFDYTDRGHVREIAAWFQSTGVTFNSMHSPMHGDYDWGRDGSEPVNIVDREKRRRIESMDEIKRAIEVAEVAPFRFLVQHVGTGGERFDPRKFEAAITAIEHLRAFARPLGVTLLVENIPNELSAPDKLVELLDTAHFADVGVCFDVGHAHIMSSVAEAFGILKPRIRSTHVHDNARDRDAHLWPGEGSIDWTEAMSLLRSAPHVPPLLFEIEGGEKQDVANKSAEAFSRLEHAASAGSSAAKR
ncbi:MAG TPA: sugar phosphate isomerase/epimerase family protein [Terriglobales bacterium]|nr:sugar phosphate isomerase/epimerase family protein [Terriglobales bacterium]